MVQDRCNNSVIILCKQLFIRQAITRLHFRSSGGQNDDTSNYDGATIFVDAVIINALRMQHWVM